MPDNAIRVIQNILKRQAMACDEMPEEELFSLIKENKNILDSMLGGYELDIIERIIF